MGRRESSLIDQIEEGALNSRVALADTLRKCLALGGQAKSIELSDWATRELNGYGPDDELPEWRTVAAGIYLDGVKGNVRIRGQQISVWDLPDLAHDHIKEEFEFHGGVGELEAMVRSAEKDGFVRLLLPGGSEMAKIMNLRSNNPYQVVERLYWSISTTAIQGVQTASGPHSHSSWQSCARPCPVTPRCRRGRWPPTRPSTSLPASATR